MITKLLMFWREIAIALLAASLLIAYNVIVDRNATIEARNITIAEINATVATDNKWTAAQMALLTNVIDNQNEGITKVLAGLQVASDSITSSVNQTRQDNARKVADLKKFLDELPTATDCSIMMNNMIRGGEAVKW